MLKRNSCYVWLGPELGMAPCDLAQGCVGHLRWPQAACHGPARAAMGRPREAAPAVGHSLSQARTGHVVSRSYLWRS